MLLSFMLVSEFELVVNSVLIGSGCTGCSVLCDDTFGLLALHHTPCSSDLSPSQSTATQGTGSLFGELLENGRQGSASASQVFTVGKAFVSSASHLGVKRGVNPLARRRVPSASPLRDLPSSEKALYRGVRFDDSVDSTFSPPPPRSVASVGKMFAIEVDADPIVCTPPDITMALGDGKTTDSDGLGDSKHAVPPSDVVGADRAVGLVSGLSSDYGSMPALPSTLPESESRSWAPTMVPVECARLGGSDMDECSSVGGIQVLPPLFDNFSDMASVDIPMAVDGACGFGSSSLADSSDPVEGQLLVD